MNWISNSRWLWRAMRGQSVTFAALFALGTLGVSVLHVLRRVLHAMHAPWYLWLLLPFVIVSVAARWETRLLPDEAQRKRWARGLIFGSLALALLIAKFARTSEPDNPTAVTHASK
jgi:4-hydroxybenzoate polyprenyltransferase